ncbi:MAG: hypothetical protein LW832_07660 [Parachlamydia sp.]|nr:hypothetical protein [Parachlamydia sp.]
MKVITSQIYDFNFGKWYYYERSLAETAMFRIKRMLGGRLKARSMGPQKTESICKCMVVNKMNKLDMPRFDWVFEVA